MRTLFSVYGYGLGHATRCEAVINKMQHETKIVASDNAYNYFNNKGMKPELINSLKIGSVVSSFSWAQTLFENVELPLNMVKDYKTLKQITNEFKPDIIVSDTEPVSNLYAANAGIKNHFLSNILPINQEYKLIPDELKSTNLQGQEAVIKIFINQVMKKSDKLISPTIKKYDLGSKTEFTDLIVRKKPSELESETEIRKKHNLPDDYILVSFGGAEITQSYYKTIMPALKKITSQKFIISTNNAVTRVINKDNIRYYPFINDYLPMLKASKAVICLSGHSTISEALVYNKPILTIPIKDHIEQLTNAVIIEEQEYGKAVLTNNLKKTDLESKISEFIKKIPDYSNNIQKAGFKGNGDTETASIISKA